MGYDSRDTAAINAAIAAGFDCSLSGTVEADDQVFVHSIKCPSLPDSQDNGKLLANAIEALTRIYPGDTVWVDVLSEDLPQYVQDAIDSLVGFGTRVIITHNGSATHGNDPRLAEALCNAVRRANVGGALWHPIEKEFVRSF
ncbi:hypothetical protein [Pseudomonas alloputida]|uniref:hypothetical protein n=1 Tax=Pseudomonas alloputida TaxID=1940621 RepID=UPI003A88164D